MGKLWPLQVLCLSRIALYRSLGIFHPSVGNTTWSTVWWCYSTTPAWMLTRVGGSSWQGWSTLWEDASGSMLSPRAGDGQRKLSSFWRINFLEQFADSIIRSHWLHGVVLFHCPRHLTQWLENNWRENKVDDSIFRFVLLSSLMVSKHRKETTQKTENITFTRWCSQVPQPTCFWHSWQLGNLTTGAGEKAFFKANSFSGLQSQYSSWINNWRFCFVSRKILSTFT